MFFLAS